MTPLAILEYADVSNGMQLLAIQPGATIDVVAENTSFELPLEDQVEENPQSAAKESRILDDKVDAEHLQI